MTITLNLPQEVVDRLSAEAERLGTTLELFATEQVMSAVPPLLPKAVEGETMLDFFAPYIGTWDGPPTNYSENTGRKYAEALVEDHLRSQGE